MKNRVTGDQYLCKCERCEHEWISRKGIPQVCANPRCHSPIWDKPRYGAIRKPSKAIRLSKIPPSVTEL